MEHAICVTVNLTKQKTEYKKVLISKRITRASPKLSLSDILDEVVGDLEIDDDVNSALDHRKFTASLSETEHSAPFTMEPDELFGTAIEFNDKIRFVNFNIITKDETTDTNNNKCDNVNAFKLLMSANENTIRQKPTEITETTAKDKLHNTVCKHLIDGKCFFPFTMNPIDVKKHVTSISNSLWYMDGNSTKVMERSVHLPTKVKPIPDRFLKEEFCGFNDWKRKRKHAPTLSCETLKFHSAALFSLISCKFTSTWGDVRRDLESLAVSLDSYAIHLDDKNDEQLKRQKLDFPPRQVGKDSWMEVREASEVILPKYSILDQSVRKLEPFEYLLFCEELHSNEHFKSCSERYHFLERLSLTVPVCILSYCPGGNLGKVTYIWKAPNATSPNEILKTSLPIYEKLKDRLPEFHTRQMRRDFISRYCDLNSTPKIPKYIFRAIYSDLTVDSTAMQNPALDCRVQEAILSDDPDLVLDLRHLNPGRPEDTFNVFFETLNKKVEDVTAVDDRRHGVCHFSQYISVADLISEVSKELPVGTPIPSESTVLYSFVPKDSHRKTAKLYTSKVPLQFKVQSRQLRVSHQDEHYCSAIIKYIKTYAVEYRNDVTLICVDDKCKVDFGEPGQAIQTGVRGKKSIVPTTSTLAALDHDLSSKGSLTPSVCLKTAVPNDLKESVYRGEVYVTYKDSIFESSTPFRHTAEIEKILRKSEVKPVLIVYSDGGPDHRVTYHSVKLALIVLFKRLGVDTLIAARTAPGHSWVNPAERIMSVLNLALQNCALTRTECSSKMEQTLRSTNSMSDIRAKAEKMPDVKPAWIESVKPIKELLESRTQRLSLKGIPFSVQDAANEDEVNEVEENIQTSIDTQIQKGKYQQQHIKSKEDYQKFLDDHCRQRHYTFQIQKCGEVNCCGPQMTQTQFPWLPDPVMNENSNHYKPYCDVVNTDTNDNRPSSQVTKPKDLAEQIQGIRNQGLVAQNVRKVVCCYECNKPRCLYSKKSLTLRDSRSLSRRMDKFDYSCGAQVIPEGDALNGIITARLQMSCETPVEFAFYASSHGRGDVCAHCAEVGAEKNPELSRQYRVVLPVCQACINLKKDIPKRNPIK